MSLYGIILKEDVKDVISGGLADGLTLVQMAKKLEGRYDAKFDKILSILKKQLALGMKVELEHTDNNLIAKEIAKDHLMEDLYYYSKLNQMESK